MSRNFLALLALFAVAAPAAAQSATIEFISPPSTKAINFSPDGQWVTGIVGSSGTGFRWSASTGYELVSGGDCWDITNDGSLIVGSSAPGGVGSSEASMWNDGSSWTHLGNPGGASGCDSFLSDFFSLSDSATVASGMSWQGCQTTAMAWTSTGGLQLLPEQQASHSSRASVVSGNGMKFAGWETANSGVRRAAVWDSISSAPSFPLAGPGNPEGFGEINHMNSDGSVICGTNGNSAILVTTSGGIQVLPQPAGIFGTRHANGSSEDGSLVAGVALAFPVLNGWIWTPETGSVGLFNHLTSLGVTGISASDVGNVTGVSNDGTKLCGWGANGSFVVTFSNTWSNVGNGLAGTYGEPTLSGDGTLEAGTVVQVGLSNALENATVGLFVGLTQINAPFKGGVLVPNPDVIITPLSTTGTGDLLIPAVWPAGVPSGSVISFQEWVLDPAGPAGLAASNGLTGTTP